MILSIFKKLEDSNISFSETHNSLKMRSNFKSVQFKFSLLKCRQHQSLTFNINAMILIFTNLLILQLYIAANVSYMLKVQTFPLLKCHQAYKLYLIWNSIEYLSHVGNIQVAALQMTNDCQPIRSTLLRG